MRKFENVDIINSLRRIVITNTRYYKEDFAYDVKLIKDTVNKEHSKDRRLLFMSRPHGTYCLRETEVFKKGSPEYNVWKYYGEQTRDKILAYAVKVTGIEGERIKGNLYELDYRQHYKHVLDKAVQGDFLSEEINPNDLTELKCVLEDEHRGYERLQKGNIEKHISDLTDAAVKERLGTMNAEEKNELIGRVEICRDYGDMDKITQFDIALYNAVTEERAEKKPSLTEQISSAEAIKGGEPTDRANRDDKDKERL